MSVLDVSHADLIEAARKQCPYPRCLPGEDHLILNEKYQIWCDGYIYGCLHDREQQRAEVKKGGK